MGFWSEMLGSSEICGTWMRESEMMKHSWNVYVSILVPFLRSCVGCSEGDGHEANTSGATYGNCNVNELPEGLPCSLHVLSDFLGLQNCPLDMWKGQATSRRCWRHGLVNPLCYEQCSFQVLPRCSFTSTPLCYWKNVREWSWCPLCATTILACNWDMRFRWWWKLGMHERGQGKGRPLRWHYSPTYYTIISQWYLRLLLAVKRVCSAVAASV